jgi:hypothetical protein
LVWYTIKNKRAEAVNLEMKLKNLSTERTIEFIKRYPPFPPISLTQAQWFNPDEAEAACQGADRSVSIPSATTPKMLAKQLAFFVFEVLTEVSAFVPLP